MVVERKRKSLFSVPVLVKEVAAPATPAAGFVEVYAKSDGRMYRKNYAGEEMALDAWNSAWGMIGFFQATANVSYTATGATDMVINPLAVRNDRNYRFNLAAAINPSASAVWTIDAFVSGGQIGRLAQVNQNWILGQYFSASLIWQPATTGSYSAYVSVYEHSGTATLTFTGVSTIPRQFWVEDIGPR